MDYRHYIISELEGRIISGWSNGPLPDKGSTGAICIREDGGYQFRLFADGEENPQLLDFDGIPLYRWDGKQAVKRPEAELEADRAAASKSIPAPTLEERTVAMEMALLTLLEGDQNV